MTESEVLFPSTCKVVSTARPQTGEPVVGLVMAQRIHVLGSRAEAATYIDSIREAMDRAWPEPPAGPRGLE